MELIINYTQKNPSFYSFQMIHKVNKGIREMSYFLPGCHATSESWQPQNLSSPTSNQGNQRLCTKGWRRKDIRKKGGSGSLLPSCTTSTCLQESSLTSEDRPLWKYTLSLPPKQRRQFRRCIMLPNKLQRKRYCGQGKLSKICIKDFTWSN